MTLGESHRLAKLGWLKTLIAPLLGLSVVLHGALLVAPVPSRPLAEVEEEEVTSEEEFVDLLSISSLASPEPEPEVPNTPPPEATPAQAPAATSTAPTQPVIPDAYPDTPPPEPSLADPAPLAEAPLAATPLEPTVPFVQEEEVVEIFTRLTRGAGDSDFDSTETSFPAIAYLTRQGISEWSPAERDCFFTQISADDYRLRPQAASLRYLTRNVQFIETQDIPRTFPAPEFQVSRLPEGYCNRPFFQILRGGQPYLFVSLVGIGVGATGQQASGLVVIWSRDPRGG